MARVIGIKGAKKLVQQIPIDKFKKLMGGFLSSYAFSIFRTLGGYKYLDEKRKERVEKEITKISGKTRVSEKEALAIAYALTQREMKIGYGR